MSIFEPRLDFFVTAIFSLILLGKIVFIDHKNLRKFKATTFFIFLLIIPVISHYFPTLFSIKHYLSIQFGLFGIVLGLIFTHLFIKINISAANVDNNEDFNAKINKRKISVVKKLPILFGVIAFTLENNSDISHIDFLCLVVTLCAFLIYASVKQDFNGKLIILSGFTFTLLLQVLLSYNELILSIPFRIAHGLLWIMSVYLIYLFEKEKEEY
ncbi:MAG: hypothetical protein HN576_13040 [Bacteriovoracaceae bacterium]|jgi:hypothetical protein|nr:hypothetical protein [Bacteriovoracaceae bacterium]